MKLVFVKTVFVKKKKTIILQMFSTEFGAQ